MLLNHAFNSRSNSSSETKSLASGRSLARIFFGPSLVLPLPASNELLPAAIAFLLRGSTLTWCRPRDCTSTPTPNRTCNLRSIRLSKRFLVSSIIVLAPMTIETQGLQVLEVARQCERCKAVYRLDMIHL